MPDTTQQAYNERAALMERNTDAPELKRYLSVARRRIWVIVAVFVIVATIGILSAFKATPVYEASARILIEKQTPQVVNFPDPGQVQSADSDYYQTQQQLVKSRTVLETAANQPAVKALLEGKGEGDSGGGLSGLVSEARRTVSAVLGVSPSAPPSLWERLGQMVEVTQVRGTHLLAINVKDTDPDRAAALANAVADAFVQHNVDRKLASSNDAFQFLQAQKKQQEIKVQQAEDALQQFRERVKVVSLDVKQDDNPVLTRLRRLQEQLTEAQLQRIDLESRAKVVHRVMDEGLSAAQLAAAATASDQPADAAPAAQSTDAAPDATPPAADAVAAAPLAPAATETQTAQAPVADTQPPETPATDAPATDTPAADTKLAAAPIAVGSAPPTEQAVFALPEVRDDAAISSLRAQILEAQKEGARLFDTYGPEHPQYRAARQKIDMLQQQLAAALPRVAASMDTQLEMLRNQEGELRTQYDAQNAAALELSKEALTYDRLMSDVERQRKLFDVLVERLREVDLTADYAKTNVEVADAAEVPRAPVSPRKVRAGILSVLLGLLLGLSAAFLAEYMDDTVNTPEDLEARTGIPVLGFVPAISRKGSGSDRPHRGRISIVEPLSSVTEAYRSIRTNLFFSAPPEKTRVMVISSGGPGDGKTTTAANLAIIIAQSGKRVLLIDADCRRPRVHDVFGLPNESGLTSVLTGEVTLAQAVQRPLDDKGEFIEGLHVLPAGPSAPNPAELLGSPAMRKLMLEAREHFDRVLIDTPPVLFVADASILAAMSDGVVLVVKSSKNTRALARRTRAQLEGVNARILGGVLNDVRLARLGYHYSDYYHYGYSRYYKDYTKAYYSEKRA